MNHIILIGLNHKTAPVELRECIAFSPEETAIGLGRLKSNPHINEIMIISTCNRVEVLMTAEDITPAIYAAKLFISEFKNFPLDKFDDALYIYEGNMAVRHIFMVASSLDSMMVGETQILGQIKAAYKTATAYSSSGAILNRLLHKTFSVAKRVRTETGIGDHAVSISYAAIELAKKIFGSLEDKTGLLIGAGEMAEMAVEYLVKHKVKKIIIANRTFERAVELAVKFKGDAIRFEETSDYLKVADIVVSSTGSPGYVVLKKQVKEIMPGRKNRPIFFIDIAVPRDIDPEINRINNAYVYDIDDLKGVINENIDDRKKEAVKGERIVDEAVIQFNKWHENLAVVPTIIELRKKIEFVAKSELRKTVNTIGHLSDKDCEALDRMVGSIINKVLHEPTMLLKNTESHRNKSAYLDLIQKLFNL